MSPMSKTLVVMAAGAGSRFGGPKQTTPVGPHGEWLLEYALFDAARAGFDRAVCIIRQELESNFRDLAANVAGRIQTTSVVQRLDDLPAGFAAGARTKPWGTGQAVLSVRDIVKTPFAIINADDFYGAEAYQQASRAADLAAKEGVGSVIAMRLDNTLSPFGPVKRGWCQTRDGYVTRLEDVMGIERKGDKLEASGRHAPVAFNGSELVSMNFWVFAPSLLPQLAEKFVAFLNTNATSADSEYLLPEVVNDLITEGRLKVKAGEAPGPWFGLTYQQDMDEVKAGLVDLTAKGVYPKSLW